jgi:hypothetical protein
MKVTGHLPSGAMYCHSRLPRGLRRGSVAAGLLGLLVRISPGYGCLSVVSVVCRQVEGSVTCRSFVQRSPTDCVFGSLSVIRCNNNPAHLQ